MVPINDLNQVTPQHARVINALNADDSSVRLQAAMTVGSRPDPVFLEALVERCGVEPDFFVRDMLTWALTRLPAESALPRIRRELDAEHPQARGQALHSLSKIGDARAWSWITGDLLSDPDDEVARTAWRVAVALAPQDEGERHGLAEALARQLARGDHEVRRSLSRALVDLGDAAHPVLDRSTKSPDPKVATHAHATQLLLRDPETDFDAAVEEAKRQVALGPGAGDC